MDRIRLSTYETNSSSSHSITVAEDDVYDRTFDEGWLRKGKISLFMHKGGYDCHFHFYRPENILVFLILSEMEDHYFDSCEKDFRRDIEDELPSPIVGQFDILPIIRRHYSKVDAAIAYLESFTGAQFEFLLDAKDNRSFTTGNLAADTGYLENPDVLKRVLFNSKSYVETVPENYFLPNPREVPTDRGGPDIDELADEKIDEALRVMDESLEALLRDVKERRRKEEPPL